MGRGRAPQPKVTPQATSGQSRQKTRRGTSWPRWTCHPWLSIGAPLNGELKAEPKLVPRIRAPELESEGHLPTL
jgi:hypothetical protein